MSGRKGKPLNLKANKRAGKDMNSNILFTHRCEHYEHIKRERERERERESDRQTDRATWLR